MPSEPLRCSQASLYVLVLLLNDVGVLSALVRLALLIQLVRPLDAGLRIQVGVRGAGGLGFGAGVAGEVDDVGLAIHIELLLIGCFVELL